MLLRFIDSLLRELTFLHTAMHLIWFSKTRQLTKSSSRAKRNSDFLETIVGGSVVCFFFSCLSCMKRIESCLTFSRSRGLYLHVLECKDVTDDGDEGFVPRGMKFSWTIYGYVSSLISVRQKIYNPRRRELRPRNTVLRRKRCSKGIFVTSVRVWKLAFFSDVTENHRRYFCI